MEKEAIVIIGFGWVGQANAHALSFLGYRVCYFDPGEPTLHYADTRSYDYARIPRIAHPLEYDREGTVYLICVGDRVSAEGVQDISLIKRAADSLKTAKGTVILRSTVLPEHLSKIHFHYYLPEFLHERYAIEECLNPLHLVIGRTENRRPEPDLLHHLETRAAKVFRGTPREAAEIKYLSNIWNALRIAFTNEMGDIMSKEGRVQESATRIIDFFFEGKAYLRYGKAYGGHCLPKDTLAFSRSNVRSPLLGAIHGSNERHKLLATYEGLPEWFSRSEFMGRGIVGTAERLWRRLHAFPLVKAIRRILRPLRRFFGRFAPTRSLAETKRLWNRLARKNARYFSHPGTESGRRVGDYELRESGRVEYEEFILGDEALGSLLSDRATKTVLDLGIGVGRHAEIFARDFSSLIGVDISEEMLRVARQRLAGLQNVSLYPTDGRHLPVPDASVDLVFSRETFESIAERQVILAYLREIFRVLRARGVAKIELRTEPAPYPWLYSSGLAFTPDEVREYCTHTGLTVHSITPHDTKHLWVVMQKFV